MYCHNCGKELLPNADVCLGCGVRVDAKYKNSAKDSTSAGWWWLGFLLPIAGLFVWIFCNDTAPMKAKKAGIGALVGFITSIVLFGLSYIGIFVFTLLGFMLV